MPRRELSQGGAAADGRGRTNGRASAPERPSTPAPGRPPLAGLVLAGGHSRRMGRDKALLDIDGNPQIVRAVATIQALGIETFVSLRRAQTTAARQARVPILHDRIEAGPMGGIRRAFEERPDHAWLVLAVDLAAVLPRTLRRLAAERRPEEGIPAVAFRGVDGGVEPLCTIFEPTAAPAIKEAVAAGSLSVRDLLRDLPCREIRLGPEGAEELRINLNTQNAYVGFALNNTRRSS